MDISFPEKFILLRSVLKLSFEDRLKSVASLKVGRSVVEGDNDGHAVTGTGERLCASAGFSGYKSGEKVPCPLVALVVVNLMVSSYFSHFPHLFNGICPTNYYNLKLKPPTFLFKLFKKIKYLTASLKTLVSKNF